MARSKKPDTLFAHYGMVDGNTGATPHLVSATSVSAFLTQLSLSLHQDHTPLGPQAKALVERAERELNETDPFKEAVRA